jgi:hypothetical protein
MADRTASCDPAWGIEARAHRPLLRADQRAAHCGGRGSLSHNPRVSETPVPIPSGSVPMGTPAWSSADAARWAQAGPASWARPVWSVPALLVTVVWAIAVEPVPRCSDAAPCGPDWNGMVQVGLAVGLLYWLVRLP